MKYLENKNKLMFWKPVIYASSVLIIASPLNTSAGYKYVYNTRKTNISNNSTFKSNYSRQELPKFTRLYSSSNVDYVKEDQSILDKYKDQIDSKDLNILMELMGSLHLKNKHSLDDVDYPDYDV